MVMKIKRCLDIISVPNYMSHSLGNVCEDACYYIMPSLQTNDILNYQVSVNYATRISKYVHSLNLSITKRIDSVLYLCLECFP